MTRKSDNPMRPSGVRFRVKSYNDMYGLKSHAIQLSKRMADYKCMVLVYFDNRLVIEHVLYDKQQSVLYSVVDHLISLFPNFIELKCVYNSGSHRSN